MRRLLLVTPDEHLTEIVAASLYLDWTLVRHNRSYTAPELFAHSNIRIMVLDDQNIAQADRGYLLNRIRKLAPDAALIYIANNHDEACEKLARTGGAQYYISKPLSPDLFRDVLQSFMRNRR